MNDMKNLVRMAGRIQQGLMELRHNRYLDSTINIPAVKREAFRLRLAKIEQEMNSLDLHQRFCIR